MSEWEYKALEDKEAQIKRLAEELAKQSIWTRCWFRTVTCCCKRRVKITNSGMFGDFDQNSATIVPEMPNPPTNAFEYSGTPGDGSFLSESDSKKPVLPPLNPKQLSPGFRPARVSICASPPESTSVSHVAPPSQPQTPTSRDRNLSMSSAGGMSVLQVCLGISECVARRASFETGVVG
jgi:hypothetical protein